MIMKSLPFVVTDNIDIQTYCYYLFMLVIMCVVKTRHEG